MQHWFVGAVLAFLLGALAAWGNYRFSRYVLLRHPEHFAAATLLRQLVHVACLLAVWFLAPFTPWDRIPLLIAAVLGITLPLFYFTRSLLRLSDAQKNDPAKKEGD